MEKCFTNSRNHSKTGLNQQIGFTLLELLIALAIGSILLGIAGANMFSAIERSQTSEALANLRMDIVFTRGEAIKRGGWVGICGSENGTSCTADFQDGWLVFHDMDKDGELNNTDTVLNWSSQDHSSLTVELVEASSMTSKVLMFNYRGYPDRSVVLTASKGISTTEFVLETTGRIVQYGT